MTDVLTCMEYRVATITLNRVDKKNSITAAMYSAMSDALANAADDADIRVTLIQGHEAIFCAGNDLGDFLDNPPTGTDSPVLRFLHTIASFPKPLIAAVCGPAVGVGTTMLFHCDLVYAGDNASFSMPFVDLGLCPEAGSSLLAPQLLGYHRAAEALLLGEIFTAETALKLGLVNRVVPPGEANVTAQAVARRLADKPSASLIATKRLMKSAQADRLLAHIGEEAAIFRELLLSPAAREAMTAFKERRKPDFSKV